MVYGPLNGLLTQELMIDLTILRARSDGLDADRREHDAALGAVDKCDLQHSFEFLDAGAQCRLRDVTSVCGAAEMAVIMKRRQMPQMPNRR